MTFQITAQSPPALADVLSGYLRQSIYSYNQLAKRSGVPRRTIVNWLDGSVRRPRQWQGLVRLAHALDLSAGQTDLLLLAAGLPTLHDLRRQSYDPADLALLRHWPPGAQEHAPAHADPVQALLHSYCHRVIAAYSPLEQGFPQTAPFTFDEIFQDPDVCLLHSLPTPSATRPMDEQDAQARLAAGGVVPWSTVRDTLHRAVIVGQPGRGKRWLLRHEALRLAREALAGDAAARIPFLVSLVDLSAHLTVPVMPDQVLRAVALCCARQALGRPDPGLVAVLMRVLVEQPIRAVFLLDGSHGLAERPDQVAPVRRALELLACTAPGAIFVTLRPLGYAGPPFALAGWPHEVELEILPLREVPIARIVRGWFHRRPQRSEAFLEALRRSPALVQQAANPRLLQYYCRLVEQLDADELPDSQELQNGVLALMLANGAGGTDRRRQLKLRLLERLAWRFATYRRQWHWQLAGEVLESLLDELPEAQAVLAEHQAASGGFHPGLLWELSQRDELLIKGNVPRDGLLSAIPYAFLHRTLHTHLVSQFLIGRYGAAGVAAPELAELAARGFDHPEWREVVALLVEYAAAPRAEALPLRHWLMGHLRQPPGSGGATRVLPADRVVWLAQLALAARRPDLSSSAAAADRGSELDETALGDLRQELVAALRTPEVPAAVRVAAGRWLNGLGDPRAEVMDADAMSFVMVAAGWHLQGSDPRRDRWSRVNELPAHSLWLPSFRIGRFPVSQAQFAQFLADTPHPYTVADYWPEAAAAGHWRPGAVLRPTRRYGATGIYYPVAGWHRAPEAFGWPSHLPNHPVYGIGWYEARAFARWLEWRWRAAGRLHAGEVLDLPSEAEWEKAARGPDGRVYPWGDEFDPDRLAWEGSLLMAAPPIGAFPQGASPYGAEEMCGHLWEWTSSVYQPYPLAGASRRVPPDAVRAGDRLVIRGGSYFKAADDCRAAERWHRAPDQRVQATFRLVIRSRA